MQRFEATVLFAPLVPALRSALQVSIFARLLALAAWRSAFGTALIGPLSGGVAWTAPPPVGMLIEGDTSAIRGIAAKVKLRRAALIYFFMANSFFGIE